MTLETAALFVAASALLILVPGPNVALIVANSLAHGARYGLLTVAGTSAAMLPQLAMTVAGMSAFVAALADWFEVLRWLGVAYLVFLGVRAWRAPAVDLTGVPAEPRSAAAIWARGFAVSLTNPKTLLFYGAFLPQFVDAAAPDVTAQLAILAALFLATAVLLDSCWALAAARARPFLAGRGRLRNRITGALLVGAGAGLALARKG
ncbi:LysE family translocator [Prosthecomicrobium sp. N25]|uniref:LysE family translocator n=1 Tax=Prosthecomicrobium sp. N25 TaxID=3129254 RepID=UPI0030776F50